MSAWSTSEAKKRKTPCGTGCSMWWHKYLHHTWLLLADLNRHTCASMHRYDKAGVFQEDAHLRNKLIQKIKVPTHVYVEKCLLKWSILLLCTHTFWWVEFYHDNSPCVESNFCGLDWGADDPHSIAWADCQVGLFWSTEAVLAGRPSWHHRLTWMTADFYAGLQGTVYHPNCQVTTAHIHYHFLTESPWKSRTKFEAASLHSHRTCDDSITKQYKPYVSSARAKPMFPCSIICYTWHWTTRYIHTLHSISTIRHCMLYRQLRTAVIIMIMLQQWLT